MIKKLFPLICLCICCCASAILSGQTPKQWDKRFGGNSDDHLYSVQQTKDAGYILGGDSYSGIGGDKTQSSQGLYDYWIVRTDRDGVKRWDRRFGGTASDYLKSVRQTIDGGYILGGYSLSGISGDKTESSRGNEDYWIVKTLGSGVKLWDRRFGGNGSDVLAVVQQTADKGYILGGSSSSGIGGDKTQDNRGSLDYWIVKTDSNGIKQWDKRFGGSNTDYLLSVQQTLDHGYILAGYSYSGIGGDKTENARGISDFWIVKTDSNGIKRWDKTFGGSNEDIPYSIQQTTDSGYIVGGLSSSNIGGEKSDMCRGSYDFWIVKTNVSGIKQWDKTFGGSSSDVLYSLQQTPDSGFLLGGGSSSGIGGDKTQNTRGSYDYWTIKTDANGLAQWNQRFGGTDYDILYSLQQTKDNGYILGGVSMSDNGGDKSQNSRGGADYWIVKLGCPPYAEIKALGNTNLCLADSVVLIANEGEGLKYQWRKNGVNIPKATHRKYTATVAGNYTARIYTADDCSQLSNHQVVIDPCKPPAENRITISPNPSKGFVTVTFVSVIQSMVSIKVVDKTGNVIFTKPEQAMAGNNVYRLNLSELLPGVYNLQVGNTSEWNNVKFVIDR